MYVEVLSFSRYLPDTLGVFGCEASDSFNTVFFDDAYIHVGARSQVIEDASTDGLFHQLLSTLFLHRKQKQCFFSYSTFSLH